MSFVVIAGWVFSCGDVFLWSVLSLSVRWRLQSFWRCPSWLSFAPSRHGSADPRTFTLSWMRFKHSSFHSFLMLFLQTSKYVVDFSFLCSCECPRYLFLLLWSASVQPPQSRLGLPCRWMSRATPRRWSGSSCRRCLCEAICRLLQSETQSCQSGSGFDSGRCCLLWAQQMLRCISTRSGLEAAASNRRRKRLCFYIYSVYNWAVQRLFMRFTNSESQLCV